MSGFAGIVYADPKPIDENLLGRLAEALQFRGPDGKAVCVQPGAGFCFTFLRTGPAPQSDKQPCTLNGNIWLIGDVRLDGRHELIAALQKSDRAVSTQKSDEELVLHAWDAWGEDAPSRLNGDFAFGIWQQSRRRLCCFRDVVGVRPFYYAHADDFVAFSNTLDVLRLVPGVDLALDDVAVSNFLLPALPFDLERTIYRGIRRLPAGHAVSFVEGKLAVRRYASLATGELLDYRDESQYVEQFSGLLTQACRERLPDGTIGAFMSGGLDSTSVTAISARLLGAEAAHRIRAFTMDLNPALNDAEPQYAKQVADFAHFPIELILLGDEEPYSSWEHPTLRTPEPSHAPFLVGDLAMYRRVADFTCIAFAGDGGDDLLLAHAKPHAIYAASHGRLFSVFGALLESILRTKRLPNLGTGLRGKFRGWRSDVPSESCVPSWIRPDFAEAQRLRSRLIEAEQPLRSDHPLHPNGYHSLNGGYWASILEEEDAAWTRVPVERRMPFLDRRLIEFLLRVPPVPWCMHKELLRQAAKGILPEAVRTRAKSPLQEDLFTQQAARLNWRPKVPASPEPQLQPYVIWPEWQTTLARTAGSELLDVLRPLSLNHWVKSA